jgi:hypothetical protein
MTAINITNGSNDYGRAQLRLTGRLQAANDGWAMNGRSNIIFAINSSASGVNVGSVGTDTFALQHNMVNNVLGFLSTSYSTGTSPILSMTVGGNVGINTASPGYPLVVSGAMSVNNIYPASNPSVFSTVASIGYSGILNWSTVAGDGSSNSAGTASYLPYIHWTNVQASYGYRQHTVLGSYRDGGANWGYAMIAVGGNDANPTVAFTFSAGGDFRAPGTVYGASKSFKIPHPIPELSKTHNLFHASVESPRLDLIYRGEVALVNGRASVNIDRASKMTDGTFVLLCRNVQCFTTNETDWTPVRGRVGGNVLTIEAQDSTSKATISWMVIGERQDKMAHAISGTDENGELIVEAEQEHIDISNHDAILNPEEASSALDEMMNNIPEKQDGTI